MTDITAAEAKNGPGHAAVEALPGSRFVVKAGEPERSTSAAHFYKRYKEFVDEQNARFEADGLWNEDLRIW